MQHGVLRADNPRRLPTNSDTDNLDGIRVVRVVHVHTHACTNALDPVHDHVKDKHTLKIIVCTHISHTTKVASIRAALPGDEVLKTWYDRWAESYEIDNPYKTEPKVAKAPVVTAVVVKAPAVQARVVKATRVKVEEVTTPVAPPLKAKVVKATAVKVGGVTLKLPKPGEKILPARIGLPWDTCTVVKVTSNFVHVDSLRPAPSPRHNNKLEIKPGMELEVRLPKMANKVYNLCTMTRAITTIKSCKRT
jgi:hypothetical protein